MIATRYQDRELFAGGVFAAANHVASFCKQVDVITCLGDSDSHEDLIRQSLKPNVGSSLYVAAGAPTTLKRRFVDPSYMRKLFEVYFMNDEPLTPDLQGEVDRRDRRYGRGLRRGHRRRFRPRFDRATHRSNALTSNSRFSGREHTEQQRQSRLQSHHQIWPRGLHLHRRPRGAAGGERPDFQRRRYRPAAERSIISTARRSSSPRASTAASHSKAAASCTPFRLSRKM